ncbi:MAG: GDP-mannose 4,6-dehydratase, partial [Prochloron sp. SP5CPC1]|nr:GDP-mannose 4,6-dehydratase [Candidatus Paraprochloron terpiosi SP5CPC1]
INGLGFGTTEKDIPNWILQLPKEQLVYFLQGFWERSHDKCTTNTVSHLQFYSDSQLIMEKLVLILAKFGIVGSVSQEEKYSKITVEGLENNGILNLGKTKQKLAAPTTGNIAWAKVESIAEFELDDYVYDFSVPEYENFVGGTYCLALHNTYGPRMLEHDGRVVSNFITQALRGNPLTVYGKGKQTRSFCYVSDLVEGLMRLMNGDYIGPVNLGNPGEYTILQLAETIQAMVNPQGKLIFKPLPQDDPQQRQPDITKAKTLLGWEPTVDLKEGLQLTIEDFRSRIESE